MSASPHGSLLLQIVRHMIPHHHIHWQSHATPVCLQATGAHNGLANECFMQIYAFTLPALVCLVAVILVTHHHSTPAHYIQIPQVSYRCAHST